MTNLVIGILVGAGLHAVFMALRMRAKYKQVKQAMADDLDDLDQLTAFIKRLEQAPKV